MLTTAPRAYGVADPAEVRQMSGREHLQAMLEGRLPTPPIMKTLSFSLAEIGDGFAAFEGDTGPHLLNPLGIVHGGWALTLIDSATGCAAQRCCQPARAIRRLRPRPISPGPSPRTRAASAPKGAQWAAGGASSPARRGSSTPRAAFWRRDLDAHGPARRRACEACAGGGLADAAGWPSGPSNVTSPSSGARAIQERDGLAVADLESGRVSESRCRRMGLNR